MLVTMSARIAMLRVQIQYTTNITIFKDVNNKWLGNVWNFSLT